MSAGGRFVIEQYKSPMGTATLFEQPVVKDGETIRYHGMDVCEYRPPDFERFAAWILCPHEYPRFAAAWEVPPRTFVTWPAAQISRTRSCAW